MVAIKPWHDVPIMPPGTNSMLRARRKDKDVRPNRLLDRTASRGMLYENEELRLRTININADLEKGQQYIKKLRRENNQLRREIWNLRDQYDKLECMLKNQTQEQDFDGDCERYDEDAPEDPDGLSIVEEESEIDDSRTPNEAEIEENCENSSHFSQQGNELPDDNIEELKKQFSELVSVSSTPHSNDDFNVYSKNETTTDDGHKMCSLKSCEEFVNVFRKSTEEEAALVFCIDEFENLTVEEIIDNIESQFKDNCRSVIKGVRLTSKNCFLTVNDAKQCETILKTGLTIREKPIKLENLWEGSTILQLSAVPHYVADDQIVKAISRFADVIGKIDRQTYKGFDTGERFVQVKTPDVIPYQLLLGSICIPITIIHPRHDEADKPKSISRRKSFRSELNISLATLEPETLVTDSDSKATQDSNPKPDSTEIQEDVCNGTATKAEPSFFSKSTGVVLTRAEVENNVFQFPTPNAPPSATPSCSQNNQNSSKKKTTNANSTRDVRNSSESPSSFRKFTQKKVNSIRKAPIDLPQPPSPALGLNSAPKFGRRASVNFRNGPGEALGRSRASEGYEFGSSYMRERSTSDTSSGRQSICRRKLSATGHEGSGKIPWCGCWGIGCC